MITCTSCHRFLDDAPATCTMKLTTLVHTSLIGSWLTFGSRLFSGLEKCRWGQVHEHNTSTNFLHHLRLTSTSHWIPWKAGKGSIKLFVMLTETGVLFSCQAEKYVEVARRASVARDVRLVLCCRQCVGLLLGLFCGVVRKTEFSRKILLCLAATSSQVLSFLALSDKTNDRTKECQRRHDNPAWTQFSLFLCFRGLATPRTCRRFVFSHLQIV